MIKKIGKGTTLEDLQKVKGGLVGACGTNGCRSCGKNNQSDLYEGYYSWERTDWP